MAGYQMPGYPIAPDGGLPVQSYGGFQAGNTRYFSVTNDAFDPIAFLPTLNVAPGRIQTIANAENTVDSGTPAPSQGMSRTFAIAAVAILAVGLLGLNYIHFR